MLGRPGRPAWQRHRAGKARCIATSKINDLIPTAYYQDRDYNGMDECSYSHNEQGI